MLVGVQGQRGELPWSERARYTVPLLCEVLRFAGGVVLYDGRTGVSFSEGLRAAPIRTLWEA